MEILQSQKFDLCNQKEIRVEKREVHEIEVEKREAENARKR